VIGDDKYEGLPNVPSMKEVNFPPIQLIGWTGLAAPAGIPAEAREWYKKQIADALSDPSLRAKLMNVSAQPAPTFNAGRNFRLIDVSTGNLNIST